jgi:hypothetical protein
MFGTFRVGLNGNGGTCRFWHIALRQLPGSDPLGDRVTYIKTNLGLSTEDQAALVTAAAGSWRRAARRCLKQTVGPTS